MTKTLRYGESRFREGTSLTETYGQGGWETLNERIDRLNKEAVARLTSRPTQCYNCNFSPKSLPCTNCGHPGPLVKWGETKPIRSYNQQNLYL